MQKERIGYGKQAALSESGYSEKIMAKFYLNINIMAWLDRMRSILIALRIGVYLLACLLAVPPAVLEAADPDDLVARLQQGGHVLMMRHAYAPGFGDPPHFQLEDCTTQRNLDDKGRTQAVAVGEWLKSKGVLEAKVYSSQYCRCLETARLIDFGPVTPLPALNSFFERRQDREPNLRVLKDFLSRQPANGPLLILVTHAVTIQAVAGLSVGSGHAVLLKLIPGHNAGVVGRLDFDQ